MGNSYLIVSIFVLIFRILVLVSPGAIAFYVLYKSRKIIKSNGSIYFMQRKIKLGTLLITAIYSIYFLLIIDRNNLMYSSLVYFFITIAFVVPNMLSMVETYTSGIYEKGIVYPGFTTNWDKIEGAINLRPTLRFIHKEKVAFDFDLEPDSYDEIWKMVMNKTIEKVIN